MSFFQMSVSGAIMIIVITILREIAINNLPKKLFSALWMVVLFKLIIPISIPLRFRLFNLPNLTPATAITSIDSNLTIFANYAAYNEAFVESNLSFPIFHAQPKKDN